MVAKKKTSEIKKTSKKNILVKNYGLFWEHDKVNWNKKPSLQGYVSKDKLCCFDQQIGIYVLYNENKEILYVGQAGVGNATLLSRLKAHNKDHLEGWWTYFSWFGLFKPDAKGSKLVNVSKEKFHAERNELLDSLEGIMIAAINPKMNKQGEKLGKRFKQYVKLETTETKKLLDQIETLNNRLEKMENKSKKNVKRMLKK